MVDSQGNTRRIDRLIIKPAYAKASADRSAGKPGKVEIIDYKSSGEGMLEHRKQLAEYLRIIKELYPDSEVSGVLVYLDSLNIVEIHE